MTPENPAMPLPDIAAEVLEAAASRVQVYPARSNWASQIGHECERYLVWTRTRWQDKAKIDGIKKLLFEGSTLIETTARDQLRGADWEVLREQEHFEWPLYQISGRTDGDIRKRGRRQAWPWEVKGMQPHEWDRINTAEDMVRSRKPWTRRYPYQLLAYLWMSNRPTGLFYLVNKTTYQPKAIWLHLEDWLDEMEACLKKLERVNAHVVAGTSPAPMAYDETVCKRCDFAHVCLPDRDWGAGTLVLGDGELDDEVERWKILSPAADEWSDLDATIKKRMKEITPQDLRHHTALIGGAIIETHWTERKDGVKVFHIKIQDVADYRPR